MMWISMATCTKILNKVNDDPQFLQTILWTDETHFTRASIVSFHNIHIWARQNPNAIRPRNFQREFSGLEFLEID
jgi:hypothetical protein